MRTSPPVRANDGETASMCGPPFTFFLAENSIGKSHKNDGTQLRAPALYVARVFEAILIDEKNGGEFA